MAVRKSSLKLLAWSRLQARKFWRSNSGDWQWLAEKPIPIKGLNRQLWRDSVPSLSFFVLLSLSGVISTMGLLAGSAATVIGAMIIAPLMGPIIGMAYAMSVANRRLFKRATMTMVAGVLANVISAVVIARFVGLRTLNPEILVRTQPTLLDLVVAIAAGAAGAFAKSRRSIADAFPGVAIAVALVPPLSVIGIGIAFWSQPITFGATLLFVTNLTAIIFSGTLVFLWQRYGSLERAQSGLTASLLILMLLGMPLGFSLRNLLIQSNAQQRVSALVQRQPPFADADLQSLTVQKQQGILVVTIEVAADAGSITADQVRQLQRLLTQQLEQSVSLRMRVVPMQEFEVFAQPD